jgi:hypothetical protein
MSSPARGVVGTGRVRYRVRGGGGAARNAHTERETAWGIRFTRDNQLE